MHPVASAGRLPTHIPSIVCGATIVDFELSPFAPREVFIASDDSKIRCFELPEEGIESDVGEAKWVLGGESRGVLMGGRRALIISIHRRQDG